MVASKSVEIVTDRVGTNWKLRRHSFAACDGEHLALNSGVFNLCNAFGMRQKLPSTVWN